MLKCIEIPQQAARWETVISVLMLVSIVLGVSLYAIGNLGYPGLWWDETAQFFSSLGIPHYADPGAKPGSLKDVIRMNQVQNLDPGGFTVLEHYWLQASDTIPWTRSLPFCFLLLAMAGMGLLGWQLSGSGLITLIALAMPLAYDTILYFGMENRAYSMEMAGVAIGVLFMVRALAAPSYGRFLVLGTVCALFLSSRYSYSISIMAIGSVILFARPSGERLVGPWTARRIIPFAMPVLLVTALILVFTLKRQLWPEMTDSAYLWLKAPTYTEGSVLAGNSQYLSLLYRNTLSPGALPVTAAIVYYLIVQRSLYAFIRRRAGISIEVSKPVNHVFMFVLALQGISAGISLMGFYPWDVGARWSAYLVMASAISSVALVAEMKRILAESLRRDWVPARFKTKVRVAGVLLIALVLIYAVYNAATFKLAKTTRWVNISTQLEQLHEKELKASTAFVTRYDVPVVRFLYEFGPFRNNPVYPVGFRFETDSEWRQAENLSAGKEGIAYIVSGLNLEELQKRFPGDRVYRVEPTRNALFGVSPLSASMGQ